jgi:Glyoxalase/Bleomycin resistance protein/Dioxygenase superfamily
MNECHPLQTSRDHSKHQFARYFDAVSSKHEELASLGVKFVSPPKRQFWGYGAEVLDPDGYMNHLWDEVTMRKAMPETKDRS